MEGIDCPVIVDTVSLSIIYARPHLTARCVVMAFWCQVGLSELPNKTSPISRYAIDIASRHMLTYLLCPLPPAVLPV